MSELKDYTLDQVAKHTTTDSCWLIIGNDNNGGAKVYDVTAYLDDHPGGAEVMLDVAGQDADEFFEDIGHSKEARVELKKYLIGNFKMDEATKAKLEAEKAKKKPKGSGVPWGAILAAIVGIGAYLYVTQTAKAAAEE